MNQNDIKLQIVSGPGVDLADVDQRKSAGEFEGKEEGHFHRTIAETRINGEDLDLAVVAATKFNEAAKSTCDALKEFANVVPGGLKNPIVKAIMDMYGMTDENLGVGIFVYDAD
jgi:hypothetical protein